LHCFARNIWAEGAPYKNFVSSVKRKALNFGGECGATDRIMSRVFLDLEQVDQQLDTLAAIGRHGCGEEIQFARPSAFKMRPRRPHREGTRSIRNAFY
jgi:hypothetical protein